MQCENPKCYQYHKDVGSRNIYRNFHGQVFCGYCGDRVDNSTDLTKFDEVPGYVKEHSDSIDARIVVLGDRDVQTDERIHLDGVEVRPVYTDVPDHHNLEGFTEKDFDITGWGDSVEPYKANAIDEIKDLVESGVPVCDLHPCEIPENILPGPMVWVKKSPGDETPKVSKIEHTDNIDHSEMDWMTLRDKINTLFLSLRYICTDMNFQHVHSRLMELNREMVNLVYQEKGVAD